MARHFAYMFEAKGIQPFVFHSGKLRDIVGASDLVAGLAASDGGDEIGKLLGGLAPDFSRRAGGAFCLHSDDRDALTALRARWRFSVLTKSPGLEFVDAIGETDGNPLDAMRDCFRRLGGIRANSAADVPGRGRPITRIAPLTGRPAVVSKKYGKDSVLIDAVGLPQRRRADAGKLGLVAERFVADAAKWKFPRDYDEDSDETTAGERRADNPLFPFRGDDRRIAVVHADLSGLGQMFRDLGGSYTRPDQNCGLASKIEAEIEAAAKAASSDWVTPFAHGEVLPLRPVLLGGDDITAIIRADLALPFTEALLVAIEKQCASIGEADGRPALSACAGVAIVGKGTPYLTAYELADSLCRFAKRAAKRKLIADSHGREGFPSALAFHLYQHSAHDDYERVIARNAIDCDGGPFTANPYYTGARAGGHCTIAQLFALATALAELKGGAGRARELRTLLCDNASLADAAWARWREVAQARQGVAWKAFETALEQGDGAPRGASGLYDALQLIDLDAITARKKATADGPTQQLERVA